MVDKSKVACFSGHRKLPQNCNKLKADLKKAIIGLVERGVTFFGAGGKKHPAPERGVKNVKCFYYS